MKIPILFVDLKINQFAICVYKHVCAWLCVNMFFCALGLLKVIYKGYIKGMDRIQLYLNAHIRSNYAW